jgi:hypothetical protein
VSVYHAIVSRRRHMRWGGITALDYLWHTELVTASLEHAAADGNAVVDA